MTTDDELPDFLKRTPEMQKRIDEWNAEHPPTSCSFVDPRVEANIKAREVEQKEKAVVRIAKMKAGLEAKKSTPKKEDARGKVWDTSVGRYVDPGITMCRANYERILKELPTARHRKIFIENYSDKVRGGVEPPKGKRAA